MAQGKKVPLDRRVTGSACQRAKHTNDIWAWDFIHDRTRDGRSLKRLMLISGYTRRCLAPDVGRGMKADEALEVLAELFVVSGVPMYIRSNKGRDPIMVMIGTCLDYTAQQTLPVEPGTVWESRRTLSR